MSGFAPCNARKSLCAFSAMYSILPGAPDGLVGGAEGDAETEDDEAAFDDDTAAGLVDDGAGEERVKVRPLRTVV